MNRFIGDFFVYMVLALFVENLLFTRGLGTGKAMMMVRKPKQLLRFMWVLSVAMIAVSCASWGIYQLLKRVVFLYALYPLVYLVCVSLIYIPLMIFYKKYHPDQYRETKIVLRLACFNTAVIGAALISMQEIISFAHAIGFAVGSSIGFSGALFLVAEAQNVLKERRIPKAFEGLPITLLYIGILSLALYGLIGHQLPV